MHFINIIFKMPKKHYKILKNSLMFEREREREREREERESMKGRREKVSVLCYFIF